MLEYVVRPFQSPGALGTIVIPSTPAASRQRATLTWSADTTLPASEFKGIELKCCEEQHHEKKRKSESVRITGNDPDNWIDVDRANQLTIDKLADKSKCGDDGDKSSNSVDLAGPYGIYFDSTSNPNEKEKCTIIFSLKN